MKQPIRLHLIIDSRSLNETTVTLEGDAVRKTETISNSSRHSQVILPLIEKLTADTCRLSDITAVYVRTDSGSFTGRRVGAAIAEMLGALLHIPVNDMPPGTSLEIPYEEDKWK